MAAILSCLGSLACTAPKIPSHAAVVLIDMWPPTLDPLKATHDSSQKIGNLIHAALVRFNPDMRVEGELAQRWEIEGYRKFRFYLRPGLRFQDGSPLTADDVVRSVKAFQRESPHAVAFKEIARARSLGDLIVELETSKPQPFLLQDLPLLKIIRTGTAPSELTGAGSYRLLRQSSNEIVLELVVHPLELKHPGLLREIKFRYVGDGMTRYQMLLRGDANAAMNSISLTKTRYLRARKPAGMQIIDAPGVNYSYLCFNFRHPILANLKVRQAIAHAIDRPGMINHRLRSFAYPSTGILASTHGGFYEPNVKRFEFDRDKAERLLDEAGYPRKGEKGLRFTLHFKTTTDKFGNETVRILASDLRAVGIDIKLDVVEPGTFFAQVKEGNFHLFHARWIGVTNPSIYFRAFHSSQIGNLNRGGYSNPVMDALLDKAMVETNDARRAAYFSQVQVLAASDLPYVSLWHWNNTFIGASRMGDIVMYPNADFRTFAGIKIRDTE